MADDGTVEQIIKAAVNAKRYVIGTRQAMAAINSSKVLVYSEKSIRDDVKTAVLEECKKAGVPALSYRGSSYALGKLCGRPHRVSLIAARGLADVDLKGLLSGA